MSTLRLKAVVFAAAIAGASTVSAESVRFEMIPGASGANDLSPDGRFVVGPLFSGDGYLWDRQTDTFTTITGANDVRSVSDDGTVVGGTISDPADPGSPLGERAARWTAATGWVSLGWLPNALNCPSKSNTFEMSADGGTIVGLSWDGCDGRGFVWTQATGMLELEGLANGSNRASVVSADGSIIAGFAQGMSSRTPAVWDAATTAGVLLDPPDGVVNGEVRGISDDGTIMLATWSDGADFNAVTWKETGGVTVIDAGQLIPGWQGEPLDIADDGTIVGFDFLVGNRRAWIALPVPSSGPAGAASWDMRLLQDWVVALGGTMPDGFQPQVTRMISADGRVITGHSGFPTPGAFVITRCLEDVDGDHSVAVTDLLDLLAAWGACVSCGTPGACPADVNGDCQVDTVDLLALLGHWGDCP